MKSAIMAKGARRRGTKTPLCFPPLHRSPVQQLTPMESTLLHTSLLMHSLVIKLSATATEKDRKIIPSQNYSSDYVVHKAYQSCTKCYWCSRTIKIIPGKMIITPCTVNNIKATCGCKFNLLMLVEQRSKYLGQSHTWLQVPGFTPQQVKHFNPFTAGKKECNKSKLNFGIHFCAECSSLLLLPANSIVQINAKEKHNLILSLW